jgi:UDP-glucose 4-epimerase
MRILVTGSSGLVGGAVAAHLHALGHEVVGLSRRVSDRLPPGVRQFQADIGSMDFMEEARAGWPPFEAVVHAAADLSFAPDAGSVSIVNCLGTQRMTALARKWASRLFLFMSSLPVIGIPLELPITEEHPVAPPTVYHATKVFGEHVVALASKAGVLGASFRLTAPIGPAMPRNRLLTILIQRALANEEIVLHGTGARRQDYVDVGDIRQAVERWLANPAEGVFNVASGRAVANLELAHACIRQLGSTSSVSLSGKLDPDDAVAWEVSIAKAGSAFGYRPAVSLDDSIRGIAAAMS